MQDHLENHYDWPSQFEEMGRRVYVAQERVREARHNRNMGWAIVKEKEKRLGILYRKFDDSNDRRLVELAAQDSLKLMHAKFNSTIAIEGLSRTHRLYRQHAEQASAEAGDERQPGNV